MWLFVDALDECGKEDAIRVIECFKSLLAGSQIPEAAADPARFHIFFTCRHYPILTLEDTYEICLEDQTSGDISTLVHTKLAAFQKRTKSRIPALITDRASGVFLWASLVTDQVLTLDREGEGVTEIEEAVSAIPQSLEEVYTKFSETMGPMSLKLIRWLCFTIEPLSLYQFRWIMILDADCSYRSLQQYQPDKSSCSGRAKRKLQTLSCGLAEVTRMEHIQFIHQFVKDFYMQKGFSILDKTITSPSEAALAANFQLSRVCVRYLAMEEISQLVSPTTLGPNCFPLLITLQITGWRTRSSATQDLLRKKTFWRF